MVYQPIVSWSRRTTFAFEALVRSSEPTMAFPGALFQAADRLDRLHHLSRAIRASCAETFRELADKGHLFINLHPDDLLDEGLYDQAAPITRIADHVVLELTERARLDHVPDLRGRVAKLRNAGFRIAIDDIGGGYSGLNSFASLHPDFVKIDMTLVRDVNTDPVKRRLVQVLIDLCADLGIGIIAEGVETHAECEVLVGLGCDLLQGYLFARPGAALPQPRFDA